MLQAVGVGALGEGASSVSVVIFPLLLIAINMWPVFTRGKAWLFGLALAIYQVEYFLYNSGVNLDRSIGGFYVSYFDLGVLASSLALFGLLGQRGWRAWRARDELRVEFDAAREVQQQLVAPAVDLPASNVRVAGYPTPKYILGFSPQLIATSRYCYSTAFDDFGSNSFIHLAV